MIRFVKNPIIILYIAQIVIIFLISLDFLPSFFVFPLLGLILIYFIFAKFINALSFFIASIPFFIALPITDNFDYMSSWRIILLALFIIWLVKVVKIKSFKSLPIVLKKIKEFYKQYYPSLNLLILALFLISIISLIKTVDLSAGIKKIIFFANIFVLYPMILSSVKEKCDFLKIFKSITVAVGAFLLVGYFQLISLFFVSIASFSQFWSDKIITVFYGKDLGYLFSHSNTWIAASEEGKGVLRMFSLVGDSHSFAIITMLSIPLFIFFLFVYKNQKNSFYFFYWILIGLSMLAIIFSGVRGAWLSLIGPFVVVLYLYFKKINRKIVSVIIISLFLFIPLFPVSSTISSGSKGGSGEIHFERVKSISDISEISNKTRLEIWRLSLESIVKNPTLGVGIGNFPVVLKQPIALSKQGSSAHNLYIHIASEIGLIGLIIFLIIVISIIKIIYNYYKKTDDNDPYAAFIISFGVIFIWILTYSFFDVAFLNDRVLMIFLSIFSLVILLDKSKQLSDLVVGKIEQNNSDGEIQSSNFKFQD